MNERLRQLRKFLDLTQEEFSKKIGIKRNTLANYEIGRNEPIDGIIFSICREFSVNEKWLRTGEGDMFLQLEIFSLDEYAKVKKLTKLELDIVRAYFELDIKTRQSVMTHFQSVFGKQDSSDLTPEQQRQLEEKVEIYKRELKDEMIRAEKEPADTSSINSTLDRIQEYKNNAPAGMNLRIARSSDHAPAQWRERDASFAEELKNAKRVTSDDDL